ncbi:MAG: hypothetical protein WC426_00140 [Sulfuriferula sp.]
MFLLLANHAIAGGNNINKPEIAINHLFLFKKLMLLRGNASAVLLNEAV